MNAYYRLLLPCLLCFPWFAPAAGKPNILWLIAEDFGPHLGCYGTKEVWTPHLDQLAADGVRYTRFYNGHVCSLSRSAFNTGMYATTIGAHNHRTRDKQPLPEGVKVLSDWMRQVGYFTANVREMPPACGFSGTGKTDWNFKYTGKPFDSAKWSDLKGYQPFYAQLNFNETHRAYAAPPKADPAKVEIPPYYPDHPVTRKKWIEDTNDQGRRLETLEELKKTEPHFIPERDWRSQPGTKEVAATEAKGEVAGR